MPSPSKENQRKIRELVENLPRNVIADPPSGRALRLSLFGRPTTIAIYDRAHLPGEVHTILDLLGCKEISPWVPEFFHRSQWTETVKVNTLVHLREFRPPPWDTVRCVTAPGGRHAICGRSTGQVSLRRPGSEEDIGILYEHADITSIAFSHDGSKVAIATDFQLPPVRIRVWNTFDGRLLKEIHPTGGSSVIGLVWSPLDDFLLAGQGERIGIFNGATGRLQGELRGCGNQSGLALLADDAFVQSCEERTIRAWDLAKVLDEVRAFHAQFETGTIAQVR